MRKPMNQYTWNDLLRAHIIGAFFVFFGGVDPKELFNEDKKGTVKLDSVSSC